MYDTEDPKLGSGKFYLRALTISIMDGWYLVYDRRGFLCKTDSIREVHELLEAQSYGVAPDPSRPHYWPQARTVVYPGWAEEQERKAIEMRNIPPPRPYEKKVVPTLTLKDLGL